MILIPRKEALEELESLRNIAYTSSYAMEQADSVIRKVFGDSSKFRSQMAEVDPIYDGWHALGLENTLKQAREHALTVINDMLEYARSAPEQSQKIPTDRIQRIVGAIIALRPKKYNAIAGVLVASGTTMAGTQWWLPLLESALDSRFDIQVSSPSPAWGVLLILIGIVFWCVAFTLDRKRE